MATQKILWTPLPQGAGNAPGALSLVVFVAPQLSAGASLSGFGDFLDWPKTLATLSFSVSVNGAVVAKDLKPTVPAGASALWGKFFASQTAVTSFETPKPAALQDLKVRSYAVGDVVRHMKELHRGMLPPNVNALQEHALPSAKSLAKTVFEAVPPPPGASLVPDLKGLASELGLRESVAAAGALSRLRPELAPTFTPGGRISVGKSRAVSVKAADILEARVFANQPVATANAALALETKLRSARLGQLAEFHDILAVLGEYPFLLTQLGLAFELTFPGAAPAGAGSVSVTADWSKAGPETAKRLPASVATALVPGAFVPASSEGHIVRGFLKAGDAALFSSTQVDADGAVAQLVQLSDALTRRFSPTKRSAKKQQKDDAQPEALPALRTAGMSLARQGQGASVRAAILQGARHAEDLSAGKTPLLYAEDLMRGLRVDVREVAGGKPGPWRSLCGRSGTYEVKGLAPQTSVDEGFVRAAAIEQKGKDGVHVHESLFRWTGWSLVVPRPGSPADPVPSKLAADPNWPLKTTFDVPPTAKLPRLRFGRTYQMRVRVADLAGRGPLAADASEAQVTPPETFLRFDPVPPPALVLRADAVEGESAERVVIRSYNPAPIDDAKPTAEKNARLVAPPPTTAELAERHGMFDLPAGGMDGARRTYDWLTVYQGAFPEKRNARKRLAYLKETRPLAKVAMPYLADPLAEAAAVRGLPTPTGKTAQKISYGGRAAWPALQPFLIALVEGAPGSQWDAASRTLTVSLPKATSVRLNLSSVPLDAARLDELGQWNWLIEGKSGVQKSLFTNTALIGGNWQLTPWRTVTLVHAVQKPLLSPDVLAATIESRLLGETHADLSTLSLACDALSSDRVALEAAWDEVTDGPPTWSAKGRGGPPVATLAGQNPAANLGNKVVEFEPPVRFTPAGGRVATPQKLTGTAIPLTFDDEVPTSSPDVRLDDTEGRGLAFYEPSKRQVRLTVPDGRQLSPRGPLRLEFPDTRHRLVTLSAVATTRFREFYPKSIWSDPEKISRKSEKTVKIHVPSTARPEAPEIAFVVPIFRWTRKPERSSRQTGLRVYLERPWFSSGDDEKLAVILLPNGKGDTVPNAFLPYVTQWGADPIWNAPGVARQAVRVADLLLVAGGRGGPKVSAGFKSPIDAKIGTVPPVVAQTPPAGGGVFKAPPVMTVPPIAFLPRQEQLFPLDEIPATIGGENVGIAAFDVDYDAERGLWFADIPLVSPAHTPFLRLALARYQPYSVPGAHLSRVVLADFAQLLPDRTLSIVRGPEARVTLSGNLPQAGASTAVEAFAQIQSPTGEGELGWTNYGTPQAMERKGDSFSWVLPDAFLPKNARVLVMEIEKIGSESRISYAESLPL